MDITADRDSSNLTEARFQRADTPFNTRGLYTIIFSDGKIRRRI